jgi:hypothetical protein
MPVTYPYTFVDDVGQTASGDQVMANFDAVKSRVDALEAVSAAQTASLSGATSKTFTGLNGNVDKGYELWLAGQLNVGGAVRVVRLRPNGVSGAVYNYNLHVIGDGNGAINGLSRAADSGLFVASTFSALNSGPITATLRLGAATGGMRLGTVESAYIGSSLDVSYTGHTWWTDTAANITSLVLNFGGGSFTGTAILRPLL